MVRDSQANKRFDALWSLKTAIIVEQGIWLLVGNITRYVNSSVCMRVC